LKKNPVKFGSRYGQAKLDSLTHIRYVWGYITCKVEKFWLSLNDNIDLQHANFGCKFKAFLLQKISWENFYIQG